MNTAKKPPMPKPTQTASNPPKKNKIPVNDADKNNNDRTNYKRTPLRPNIPKETLHQRQLLFKVLAMKFNTHRYAENAIQEQMKALAKNGKLSKRARLMTLQAQEKKDEPEMFANSLHDEHEEEDK